MRAASRRRSLSALLSAALTAAVIIVPAPALAQGAVDQENPPSAGGFACANLSDTPQAQTFVPTVDNIVGVDLMIARQPPGTVTVSIRNGLPEEPILTSTTLTSISEGWNHFALPRANLVPGQTYSIYVSGTRHLVCYQPDSYPDGVSWWLGTIPRPDVDLVFRTYYEPPNEPPTADAGPHQTVAKGLPALLDGSGSFDPDGDSLTYSWTAPSGVTLNDPMLAKPTATFPGPGTYVFALVVNDGTVDSAPDTMTVTVTNSPPVAHAGLDQEIAWAGAGTSATLDGSGSSDPDGDPLTHLWSAPGGVLLDDATLVGPTATFPGPGTYVFTLVVNDGTVDSPPDFVQVTVDGPPTANANGPYVVQFLEDIQLDGTASSDFEGPVTYAWTVTDGTLDDPTLAEPTYTAPYEPGTYTAELTVTDTFGQTDTTTAEIHVFDPIVYSPWTGPGVRTDGVCEILIWWDNAHVLADTDADLDDWSISAAARFYAYDARVDREISSTSQTTFSGDAGDSVVLEQQWRTESWQRFANQVRLDDISLVITEDDGRAGNDRGTLSVSPNELITCGETVHLTLTTLVLPGAARGQISTDSIGAISVDLTITTVPVWSFRRPV